MNAIPARVAGVERLVVCAPTPDGAVNPLVLLAARLAGVDTVYRIGGAQAIAALAYGTETIAPVDKITGPGNAWVAAAKRRVFGRVGIDMIAGPSEVLVIADADNDPDWIALDLLAQAEHDAGRPGDPDHRRRRLRRSASRRRSRPASPPSPRRAIAGASWRDHGAVIIVRGRDEAVAARRPDRARAPRDLTADAEALAERVRHAGAIFLGALTAGGDRRLRRRPEPRAADGAVGALLLRPLGARLHEAHHHRPDDAGGARAPSARRPSGWRAAEGLEAHGLSVRARLDRLNEG